MAGLGAALLLLSPPSRAATVGAQWANQDTNGDPYVPNTGTNAAGFYNTMGAFGHTRKFLAGNSNFWTGDTVDPNVSGSWDQSFADNVNIYFFSTHGGSYPSAFLMSPGRDNTVNGVTGHFSWTNKDGKQW